MIIDKFKTPNKVAVITGAMGGNGFDKESTIDLDSLAASIRFGLLLASPPLLDGQ